MTNTEDQGRSPREVICEVCVESVDGVRAAAAGGADRIELCQDLDAGGLTPSHGLMVRARSATRLPIVAMVRPRGGDFAVTDAELESMLEDVAHLRACGADGIVTGVLTPDGDVDATAMQALIEAAGPLPVTCHRAFDMARDPFAALETVIVLGCARILTSGAAASVVDGQPRIRELTAKAGARILVMPGGGVRADNVAALIRATGVREVHFSASAPVDGPMRFRNPACSMGAAGRDEYARRITDETLVRATVTAARSAPTP